MIQTDRLTPHEFQDVLLKLRNCIRVKHHSIRTEEAYVHWIRQFLKFHYNRKPELIREPDVTVSLHISQFPDTSQHPHKTRQSAQSSSCIVKC